VPHAADATRSTAQPIEAVTALLVDADRSFVQFAQEELNQTSGSPVRLLHAPTLAWAEQVLAQTAVSVLVMDPDIDDGDGFEWLTRHRASLQAAVILLTDRHDRERPPLSAVGAQDVIVKARLDGDHLADAIRYAAERERTRQQLLESREHFQSLIEHARDLITVLDDRGHIVYQSPSVVELLGTPPNAFRGGVFAELVHPEDAAGAHRLVRDVFAGEGTPGGEFRLPHADGSMRTFDVVASRMTMGDGSVRAVLNARDITERCRAEDALRLREAQLRQAQKMEAVGRLAGGIAHDFSNVLTVISGACERLQDDIAEGEARPEQVQLILRHCARATALTRQLLAFSRQQTIAPRVVELGALVRRAGELVLQLLGANIVVDIDVEEALHRVEVDPVQMEQVLMNLAINARDAMPDGGRLRVSVRNTVITAAQAGQHPALREGDYVLLEVADTGHGMTPDVQARAFEPFFTTKDPTRGTGLGLATVYGIVTQSRGHIWIDSAPGAGTRFEIYLPASDARTDAEESVLSPLPANTAGAVTVLITEDDPDLRELLHDTLAARGYDVVEAGSPAEAMAVAAECPRGIDLLLTDLVMPGGSGRELARRMQALSPGLKVLYMSGFGEPGCDGDALLEPGDPFLAKPFTRQQLLTAIGSLIA
jgi:PAS domain S-box-containing protein